MPVDYSKFRPEQIEAAKLLVNREAGEKLTIEDIAKRVGVDPRTIYRWKNDPEFIEMVNEIADMHMNLFLNEVYAHLRQQVRRGSVRAMELALRRMGKLIDRKEVSGDVKMEVNAVQSKSNEELKLETEKLERELLESGDDEQ